MKTFFILVLGLVLGAVSFGVAVKTCPAVQKVMSVCQKCACGDCKCNPCVCQKCADPAKVCEKKGCCEKK